MNTVSTCTYTGILSVNQKVPLPIQVAHLAWVWSNPPLQLFPSTSLAFASLQRPIFIFRLSTKLCISRHLQHGLCLTSLFFFLLDVEFSNSLPLLSPSLGVVTSSYSESSDNIKSTLRTDDISFFLTSSMVVDKVNTLYRA